MQQALTPIDTRQNYRDVCSAVEVQHRESDHSNFHIIKPQTVFERAYRGERDKKMRILPEAYSRKRKKK
jgi:hypothetical protein